MAINPKETLLHWNKQQTTGIEFEEVPVLLTKATIVTGNPANNGKPFALNPPVSPTAGMVLSLISDGQGGLKVGWVTPAEGHQQNTDQGTNNDSFYIGATKDEQALLQPYSINNVIEGLNIKSHRDTGLYIDVRGGRFYTNAGDPLTDNELARKKYVDDKILDAVQALDAFVFKGSIGASGLITSEDPQIHNKTFGADVNMYKTGWTFLVTTAQTLQGFVLDQGDKIIAIKDVTGSTFAAADWVVIQGNIVGAVTAANNFTNDGMIIGAGANKTLKALAMAQYSLPVANTANKMSALTLPVNSLVGRKATGGITPISATSDIIITSEGTLEIGAEKVLNGHIAANTIELSKLVRSSVNGLSVIGRAINTQGSFTEITADYDKSALVRYGNTVGFSKVSSDFISLEANGDVEVPTAYNAGAGSYIGQVTTDYNFIYICLYPGVSGTARWGRIPIAKVW